MLVRNSLRSNVSGHSAIAYFAIFWLGCFHAVALASNGMQADDGKSQASTSRSLGVTRVLEQIVLPGSELTHKQVDPATSPLIVRVVESFPHGTDFRYDISYFGMTEGVFDLKDFLVRIDGSSTDDLPSIPVKVNSILEEGQIEPNDLEIGGLSGVGGYWRMVYLSAILWTLVLACLIFIGRKRKQIEQQVEQKQKTLADLLQPSVEQAVAGKLPPEKHAELERFLFTFWQKRLGLQNESQAEILRALRDHEESGPLIQQMEQWLHAPSASQSVNVEELLAPYREVRSDDLTADDINSVRESQPELKEVAKQEENRGIPR